MIVFGSAQTRRYGNDVSVEHVDMNACDHSKQGIETQIASENHNDPEEGVTYACESSKNVPDEIEKVVTDVGPKEVMGESEHSQNEFAHENNDVNANDQYKHGPETDIGTDKPKKPELEGTDGGYVGTGIISPQEGASDDKSDEPPVMPSNPPPNGKILMYQKYLESKKQQEEEKKKKEKKKRKEEKKKKKIKVKS